MPQFMFSFQGSSNGNVLSYELRDKIQEYILKKMHYFIHISRNHSFLKIASILQYKNAVKTK